MSIVVTAIVIGGLLGVAIGVYLEVTKRSDYKAWWCPMRFLEISLALITTALAIFSWDVSARFGATGFASMFWTLFVYESIPFLYRWLHYRIEPLDKSPEPVSEPRHLRWRSSEERRQQAQLELAKTIASES